MTRRLISLTASALASAALTAGCSTLDLGGHELAAGDAVRAATEAPRRASPAATDGWTVDLQLPDGRLTARVVPLDTDEVAADDTFENQGVSAADGTTLVAVSWSLEQLDGVPLLARTLVLDAGAVDDEVALLDGDRRVPLDVDGLDHTQGYAFAAVDDATDLTLVVDFDGVAQSIGADDDRPHVDDAAQPLYDPGAGRSGAFADCRTTLTPSSLGREGYSSCRARTATWPWVAGAGWASDATWRLVQLETSLGPASGSGVSGTTVRATVDGQAPRAEHDQGGDALITSTLFVFAGGERLEVDRTSTIHGSTARLTGTLTLR